MNITYKIIYKASNRLITQSFKTFASAAGMADAIGKGVLIGATIENDGDLHSGTLYKYVGNKRVLVNRGFLNTIAHAIESMK